MFDDYEPASTRVQYLVYEHSGTLTWLTEQCHQKVGVDEPNPNLSTKCQRRNKSTKRSVAVAVKPNPSQTPPKVVPPSQNPNNPRSILLPAKSTHRPRNNANCPPFQHPWTVVSCCVRIPTHTPSFKLYVPTMDFLIPKDPSSGPTSWNSYPFPIHSAQCAKNPHSVHVSEPVAIGFVCPVICAPSSIKTDSRPAPFVQRHCHALRCAVPPLHRMSWIPIKAAARLLSMSCAKHQERWRFLLSHPSTGLHCFPPPTHHHHHNHHNYHNHNCLSTTPAISPPPFALLP